MPGTAWSAGTVGTGATLQNSQCSLNMATTSVTQSGNTLTLNLATTFESAFTGVQNVFMYAGDVSGSNTGWVQRGTWTVPGSGPHTGGDFGDAEFGIESQPKFHVPIFRYRRNGQLVMGVGLVQRNL